MNTIKDRYEIADLRVVMTTYHEKTRRQALPYLAKSDWSEEEADIQIKLDNEFYEERVRESAFPVTIDSVEYVYTGEAFHRYLLHHQGCMLHSSAVVVDGYAYLFSADSGTGKSTHTSLWLKHFGENAFIINDDKPTLRKTDQTWYVYGTPWSGKTNTNVNTKVKLGAIVFLERAKQNWIEKLEIQKAIPKFFGQTTRKHNREENMDFVLESMGKILAETPVYQMGCDISDEAVTMAYEKIRRV